MDHDHGVAIAADERTRLTQYLEDTRERLLRSPRSLTPEQLDYKPAPERWSVGEILEHLAIAESRLLPRIEEVLRGSTDPTKRSAWEGGEELLGQLEAVRQRTSEFAATTHAELRRYFSTHPVLGELDCYQWLLIAGAHFERHCAQVEEIMADANFPRPIAAA